jgi:hypothetical protein
MERTCSSENPNYLGRLEGVVWGKVNVDEENATCSMQ